MKCRVVLLSHRSMRCIESLDFLRVLYGSMGFVAEGSMVLAI